MLNFTTEAKFTKVRWKRGIGGRGRNKHCPIAYSCNSLNEDIDTVAVVNCPHNKRFRTSSSKTLHKSGKER